MVGCNSCISACGIGAFTSHNLLSEDINFCIHLNNGRMKTYTYLASDYPTNSDFGNSSLWSLVSDNYYTNFSYHYHNNNALIYSNTNVNINNSDGTLNSTFNSNDYDDLKRDIVTNYEEYVNTENYNNNITDPDKDNDNFLSGIVNGIGDLLKYLFIPSSDFYKNWFDDINSYLGDRFGIVYYPLELTFNFLERITEFGTPGGNIYIITHSLHIPEFKLFGTTLISPYTINFDDFVRNEPFSTIYQIYLCAVDVILIFSLLVLCYNTMVDIFGGHYVDSEINRVSNHIISKVKKENKK